MTQTMRDVVVAGAGHNGLITAAYVARSGRRVVVLDARSVPGGGAATEELLLPGYGIDSCSTGHTLILGNPVIADDELDLVGVHGLRYVYPDPVARAVFPDGESITMWLDRERTASELGRFSPRDAETYLRLLDEWSTVADAFRSVAQTPVGWGPSLDERLAELPTGGVWRRRRALSAWDVVHHDFESRHVRAFLLWMAFQTYVPPDAPGTGALVTSLLAGRQRRSWSIPLGGSGRLTDALVADIETHGGEVVCDQRVTRLLVDGRRCVGVETASGERYVGRDAVVSSIHVKHLLDMAPRALWPEDFRFGVETFDPGIGMFAVHLAVDGEPRLRGTGAPLAVSSGLISWPEDLVAGLRAIREGAPASGFPWVLVATPTIADPTRAPAGHHTVKLLIACSPTPPGGAPDWDAAKEEYADRLVDLVRGRIHGLEPAHVLARLVQSPVDIERANPHMIGGAPHGGDRGVPFSGPLRPAPGWAQHRMPLEGLYQTGGSTHPGGSITGAPGRNAAAVLLHDLGTSLDAVVAGRVR